MGLGLRGEPGVEGQHLTSRVWMCAGTHIHTQTHSTCLTQALRDTPDPRSEGHLRLTSQRTIHQTGHALHNQIPGSPTPASHQAFPPQVPRAPEPHLSPRERLSEPRKPSAHSWGLQILTLSCHHPLRVPLGQHPCVPIEAGLLHLRERESSNG